MQNVDETYQQKIKFVVKECVLHQLLSEGLINQNEYIQFVKQIKH